MIVLNDLGGNVDGRVIQIEQMNRGKVHLEVKGQCLSACTMFLAVSGMCVWPQALFGFHGPRTPLPGIPMPAEDFQHYSQIMADHYPPKLAKWFMVSGRGADMIYMRGTEVIKMGAHRCK